MTVPPVNFDATYLERDPENLLNATHSLLDSITYKPGWKFRLEAKAKTIYAPWYIEIHLDYEVESLEKERVVIDGLQWHPATGDSRLYSSSVIQTMVSLTTSTTLTEHSLVEVLVRGDLVRHVAVNLIRRAELHEMDEWLKLDGKCVNDPHPELRVKPPAFVPDAAHQKD
jgi:hypothetical protein